MAVTMPPSRVEHVPINVVVRRDEPEHRVITGLAVSLKARVPPRVGVVLSTTLARVAAAHIHDATITSNICTDRLPLRRGDSARVNLPNPRRAGGLESHIRVSEVLKVDTGNIAFFESDVKYDVETVKGFTNIFFGGEGLFLSVLEGPGKVWLQSLNTASFAARLMGFMPSKGG